MGKTTKLFAFTNGILMRRVGSQPQDKLMSGFAVAHAAPIEHQTENQINMEEDQQIKILSPSNEPESDCKMKKVMEMNWVPHPRTGIYYPEGQDWVMDGVPDNAASLGQGQTYWLRNIDGVEKPDPELPSADHYLLNP